MASDWLMVIDTPGIKEFVFATDRLAEIRGASAILDRMSRERTPAILEQGLGESRVETVFSNAGAGQFLLKDVAEDAIERTMARLRRELKRETGGMVTVVHACVPLKGDYTDAVRLAFMELARRKLARIPANPEIQLPWHRDCDACSAGQASHRVLRGEREQWVCDACRAKVEAARKQKRGGMIQLVLEGMEGELKPPQSFSDIGSRVALVYADGNAMGRKVKLLRSPEQYRHFSTAVDGAVRSAVIESLSDLLALRAPESEGVLPADILLLGGDDLLVALPADLAFRFVERVSSEFEHSVSKAFAEQPGFPFQKATLSFGVVVAQSKTPFYHLLHSVEALLKSAKDFGASQGGDDPDACFDFQWLDQASAAEIEDARRQSYTFVRSRERESEANFRTLLRPYRVSDIARLRDAVSSLSSLPRNRIQAIYRAVQQDQPWAGVGLLEALVRAKPRERESIYRAFDALGYPPQKLEDWMANRGDTGSIPVSDMVEMLRLEGGSHA